MSRDKLVRGRRYTVSEQAVTVDPDQTGRCKQILAHEGAELRFGSKAAATWWKIQTQQHNCKYWKTQFVLIQSILPQRVTLMNHRLSSCEFITSIMIQACHHCQIFPKCYKEKQLCSNGHRSVMQFIGHFKGFSSQKQGGIVFNPCSI